MSPSTRTFCHPRWIGAAALVMLVSYLFAAQDTVPSWELSSTEWINAAPDWVAGSLYPVMQLGTVWAPVVLALVILLWRRDRLLAGATAAAGLVAWFGAKGIKHVVGRDRPLSYLPGIDVREGEGTGLGFVSGHAAVAATTAVIAMAVIPPRWRPVAFVLAALVGLARIVHGVHLPADVVGGWGFGAIVGLVTVELVDRWEGRIAAEARAAAGVDA